MLMSSLLQFTLEREWPGSEAALFDVILPPYSRTFRFKKYLLKSARPERRKDGPMESKFSKRIHFSNTMLKS